MSNTADDSSLILQLTAAFFKNFLCHVVMLHLVQTQTHTHTQKKKKEKKKKRERPPILINNIHHHYPQVVSYKYL